MYWETFVLSRVVYEERVNRALEEGRIRRLRVHDPRAASQVDRLLAHVGQALVGWGVWLQQRTHTPLAALPPAVSRQNG